MLQVAGAELQVDVAVGDHARGVKSMPILRAVQRAVAGISCIRPDAPTLERASMMKRDLLADQAVDVGRVEPELAARARTTSSRNGMG